MIEHRVALADGPDVLAVGAWFKNTVCVARAGRADITATVGDLDGVEACLAHEAQARSLLAEPPSWRPRAIAHDLHPDFHSTRTAATLAAELAVPTVAVQHHHAHIAATVADAVGESREAPPVVGLALDGVGLGSDGQAWGGEQLVVQGARWNRLGGLRPIRLPGGDRAAREPWRMAAAILHDLGRGAEIAERYAGQPAAAQLAGLLDKGTRCPPTSSMGRLFDAAAGLLGLSEVMAVEAEAAIALEGAATAYLDSCGPLAPMTDGWHVLPDGTLDLLPLLASLVDESDAGAGAARFHVTLIAALVDWVEPALGQLRIDTVAVGGGCLFNRILRTGLRESFTDKGIRFVEPNRLLPGDTAVAFGQAVIARDLLARRPNSQPPAVCRPDPTWR